MSSKEELACFFSHLRRWLANRPSVEASGLSATQQSNETDRSVVYRVMISPLTFPLSANGASCVPSSTSLYPLQFSEPEDGGLIAENGCGMVLGDDVPALDNESQPWSTPGKTDCF
jgi:hypothetical protein